MSIRLVAVAFAVAAILVPAARAEAGPITATAPIPRPVGSTAAPASDPTPVGPPIEFECGHSYPTGTNFVLTHDVNCDVFGILSYPYRGYTLDLQGHTLTVSSSDTLSQYPQEIVSGASITNGTLVNAGIFLYGHVDRVRVVHSAIGLAPASRLTHSVLTDSSAWVEGSQAQVTENVIRGGRGIIIDDVPKVTDDFLVARNDVSGSTQAGITYCVPYFLQANDVGGTIAANHSSRNAGPGIQICGAVQNFSTLTIAFNLVDHNAGAGISTTGSAPYSSSFPAGGPFTITANLAVANGGAGIDGEWVPGMPSQVRDGGYNVALFNQKRCVGVRCALDLTSHWTP